MVVPDRLTLLSQAQACMPDIQAKALPLINDPGSPDGAPPALAHQSCGLIPRPAGPSDLRQLLLLARKMAGDGDGPACRDACRLILQQDPVHRPARLLLIQSLTEAGRVADALDQITRHLTQIPADAAMLRRRVLLLRQDDRLTDAVRAGHEGLRLCPDDPGLRLALIDARAHSGDAGGALSELQPLLSQAPDDADLMLRQLRILRLDAQLEEARRRADLAVMRHPRDIRLWLELALICRQSDDPRAGLAACRAALALQPDHPGAAQEQLEMLIRLADHAQILALAHQAAAILSQTPDAVAALRLCRALTALPGDALPGLLRLALPGLRISAAALPGDLIWQICVLAEPLGLGPDLEPLLSDLLARPRMDLALARSLLMQLFTNGQPDWVQQTTPLALRLAEPERALFLCELAALDQGAAAALARRRRDPQGRDPARLRTARLILLARLLRQTGRVQLAARHQRMVLRRQRLDPTLFRLQFSTLLQAGFLAEARALLRRIDTDEPGARWRMIVAQSWAELDQPDRACRIAERAPPDRRSARGDLWYPRCLLRIGRVAEARALFDRLGAVAGARGGTHFGPSINGVLQMEAEMDPGGEPDNAALLVSAAIRRIGAAPILDAPFDTPPIPQQIVQYWDSPSLPRDIAAVTASWAGLRGWRYQRFDRGAARQFLQDRLGRDWRLALEKARSPTEESDFFRLCWLAVEGGIYADCDDWRTGHPRRLLSRGRGLILLREPVGAVANNFIAAMPRHPALVWAAVAARHALDQRHNDSVWSKTGPGLLTRAVAWYLDDCARKGTAPALTILPQYMAGLVFDPHVPLTYKSTTSYWNADRRSRVTLPRMDGPRLTDPQPPGSAS